MTQLTHQVRQWTDNNGFTNLEIITSELGRIVVTDFNRQKENKIHMHKATMNPKGMGYSHLINSREELKKAIKDIKESVWLPKEAKDRLEAFLIQRHV